MADKTFVENELDKIKGSLEKEMERLQSLADAQVQPPKSLHKYTDHTKSEYKYSRFDNMWGTFDLTLDYYFWRNSSWSKKVVTQEGLDSALAQFDSAVEKWKSDNLEAYEANQEVIKHNTLQYERVRTIMKTLGVKEMFTRSYFKTSRSRKMTTERTAAKWPSEVRDALPMKCGWEDVMGKFKKRREQIENFGLKLIKEQEEKVRKEAAEKERKEKEEKRLKTLAVLGAKYDLGIEAEPDDIQEAIINQCKYLRLAHFMELNRSDWTDGYSYAEMGLERFNVESPQDQEIYDDVQECIESGEDGDIDGRIFRDTKWNYSVIYGLVDEKLMEDCQVISEYIDEVR